MASTSSHDFRAAVLFEQNKPLKVLSLTKVLPEEGQVGVRMISASLCGAQWNEITGVKGLDKFLPHMMGHEGLGEVVAVGRGVTKVHLGDYVVLHWRKGTGHDCFGPKFKSEFGEVGSGSVTTFSEYSIVAENRVTVVTYNPKMKYIYPLVGCALSTSWGLLVKEVQARKEDTLFICGAGGLGIAIGFWARMFELKRLAMFDRFESKRLQAKRVGAVFHSAENGDSIDGIDEKFDIVIDTTGDVENISSCFNMVKAHGRLVLVGQPKVGSVLKLHNPLRIFDGIKIFSSEGGLFFPDEDVKTILALLEGNRELVSTLVSHVIRLDEINEGFRLMRDGQALRVVIDFEGD